VFYPCVDIFDLTVHLRSEDALDIASAVGRNFDVTQSLVTRFIQMGGTAPTDAYVDTQKAQTEVLSCCRVRVAGKLTASFSVPLSVLSSIYCGLG
jgi:hypothetical protein